MKRIVQMMSVCSLFLFTSCSSKTFEPLTCSNPWKDDYRDISSMKDYGKWGTYNVHDPSCKLFGDTYYM